MRQLAGLRPLQLAVDADRCRPGRSIRPRPNFPRPSGCGRRSSWIWPVQSRMSRKISLPFFRSSTMRPAARTRGPCWVGLALRRARRPVRRRFPTRRHGSRRSTDDRRNGPPRGRSPALAGGATWRGERLRGRRRLPFPRHRQTSWHRGFEYRVARRARGAAQAVDHPPCNAPAHALTNLFGPTPARGIGARRGGLPYEIVICLENRNILGVRGRRSMTGGRIDAAAQDRTAGALMTIDIRGVDKPGLYCVELRTNQWEKCVSWYRDGLGLACWCA